jgi:hypothetical protein
MKSLCDMPVRFSPPERAARVLPMEYWESVFADWSNFRKGIDPAPPRLTLPGRRQVYFTDPESIFTCEDAADFGERLGLQLATEKGCGVVFFDTRGLTISVPTKADRATRDGLTTGGAREWIINGNPSLDLRPRQMEAFEVAADSQRIGPVS